MTRFLHLADLHLGKRLKEFSLLADQKFVLEQALDLVKKEHLDGVIVAGDIYDSAVPSAEATQLLDYFVTALFKNGTPLYLISGNHDSAEKLAFGSHLFDNVGVHIVTDVSESLKPLQIGDCSLYLLPFSRPSDINYAFGTSCKTTEEALKEVLKRMAPDPKRCNLLIAHQMVLPSDGKLTTQDVGGSEEFLVPVEGISIGDVSAVSADIFQAFDYVALGHIHKEQDVGKNVRYPGALLKYHRDEAGYKKEFTIVDVDGKNVHYETRPYALLHEVIKAEGTLEEILKMDLDKGAFIFAILDDLKPLDNPMERLRSVYPNAAWIDYKDRSGWGLDLSKRVDIENHTKEELFAEFFTKQTGHAMDEEEQKIAHPFLVKKEGE